MRIDEIRDHVFPAHEFTPEMRLSGPNYARVIGSSDARFFSTSAATACGYPSRPLPLGMLTFFHTVDEPDLLETLGITYGKTLFGGLEIEFGDVVTEQQALVGQTSVVESYERSGSDGRTRQFLVLQTEFKTTDGRLISRSRLTFIERLD